MPVHIAVRGALVALAILTAGAAPAAAQQDWRREVFREFDTDGDGRISRVEFELKKLYVVYRDAKHREPRLRLEDTRLSPRAFNELDLKKDGVLDIAEIVAAPPFQFEHWDRNRDGVIDWAEFNAVLDELQH
jgi:hypothetical protein